MWPLWEVSFGVGECMGSSTTLRVKIGGMLFCGVDELLESRLSGELSLRLRCTSAFIRNLALFPGLSNVLYVTTFSGGGDLLPPCALGSSDHPDTLGFLCASLYRTFKALRTLRSALTSGAFRAFNLLSASNWSRVSNQWSPLWTLRDLLVC